MSLSTLNAISPIDGRYRNKVEELSNYFSEESLIKYRVLVEVEYFIALCEVPLQQLEPVDNNIFEDLRNIYKNFTAIDATAIKDIENVTNHDVKAVEYFIKEKFDALGLSTYKEFIHFGLTSQDINNTAVPLSIKDAVTNVYVPEYNTLLEKLKALSTEWADIPMLARTHGQPASPTRLGKELDVFVVRLEAQFNILKNIPNAAKFGGATGNFNAHHVAYPNIDWKNINQVRFFDFGFHGLVSYRNILARKKEGQCTGQTQNAISDSRKTHILIFHFHLLQSTQSVDIIIIGINQGHIDFVAQGFCPGGMQ